MKFNGILMDDSLTVADIINEVNKLYTDKPLDEVVHRFISFQFEVIE
jgi:hypothetical protein